MIKKVSENMENGEYSRGDVNEKFKRSTKSRNY